MDYNKIYANLIERSKNRTPIPNELYEKHHIIPKCMGGSDDISNITKLTPEEHYVAHQLLVKMYDNSSLIYALNMMSVGNKFVNRNNNKRYGWVKRKYITECKQRTGTKNGSYGRRWYHNPETLEASKFKKDEVPNGWQLGRVPKNKVSEKLSKVCDNDLCDNTFLKTKSSRKRFCSKKCESSGRYKENGNVAVKSLSGREKEFIDLYEKNGSINKSLKSMGFTGSGGYYHWAKKLIECSTNGSG